MPNPIVGITDGELISDTLELAQIIQPLEIRKANLENYLEAEDVANQMQTVTISSYDELLQLKGEYRFLIFEGPCCEEIKENALEIRYKQLGVQDELIRLKPVRALDGDKLSSARIRLGEIDRKGSPLRGTKEPPRRLPDSSRSGLQTPKGEVFSMNTGRPEVAVVDKIQMENPNCVIAVGDVTSETLIAEGYTPDVCVIDGITKRGVYPTNISLERQYTIFNPAATLYPEAWSAMATAIDDEGKSLIFVEGEEDLMGFPAVLLAKEGAVLLYGQPNVGIVWVPVNRENRELAKGFLEQMPIIT